MDPKLRLLFCCLVSPSPNAITVLALFSSCSAPEEYVEWKGQAHKVFVLVPAFSDFQLPYVHAFAVSDPLLLAPYFCSMCNKNIHVYTCKFCTCIYIYCTYA